MKKIGTADIIWKEFDNFVKTEKEHSMKKLTGGISHAKIWRNNFTSTVWRATWAGM